MSPRNRDILQTYADKIGQIYRNVGKNEQASGWYSKARVSAM